MQPLFKNIYDSGIIDKWFSNLGNAALSSAAAVAATSGNLLAEAIAFISYLFLAASVSHGTREPYEFFKSIYVYETESRIAAAILYSFIGVFRILIMSLPILVFWWVYKNGIQLY
jgi:hypothetical protein